MRTGNVALAALELEEMEQRWQGIARAYGGAPPPAYAADPQWAAVLSDVAARIDAALRAIDAGEIEEAQDALAPIRWILSDQRRRAGLQTFSDRVDAVSRAMDDLWVFRHEPPDFADAAAVGELEAGIAQMRGVVERCVQEAPASTRGNKQFQRLMAG